MPFLLGAPDTFWRVTDSPSSKVAKPLELSPTKNQSQVAKPLELSPTKNQSRFWEGDATKRFSVKKGVFSEKGGGNSVNRGFG